MIGFYDVDFYDDKKIKIPNLEIMKLSSYYQTEERQFCRLILPEESDFDSYDKIYVFSEQDFNKKIPLKLRQNKNVIYGGSGFSSGTYIPFENKLIDYSLPSTQIYKNYLTRFIDGKDYKMINSFLDNCYYRMYAGENELPIPRMIKNHKMIIYDRKIFYDNWEDIFGKISERNPSTILTIHPIYCNTLTQFFKLKRYPKFSSKNELILNIGVPFSELNTLFSRYGLMLRADIWQGSNVSLPISGAYANKFQYYENFDYTMNVLYSFWANKIPIKLYYEHPQYVTNNPLESLTKLVVNWSNLSTERKRRTTLNEIITKKSENEETKKELIKYNINWRRLFNQSYDKLSNRGYWGV